MTTGLQSIDVTKLVEYTKKIEEVGSLNKMLAPNYLRDFINAMDTTSSMLCKAVKSNLEYKAELERFKAIAYLDKATEYLGDNNIKVTDNNRKMYVDLDKDVLESKNKFAASEAMVLFLKNKYQSFRCAHDDVKKISFSDTQGTSFEGF